MSLFKLFFILLVFVGENVFAEEIIFETDVNYRKDDQPNLVELKAGNKINIKRGESLLAISKQNVPVLIVSPISENSQISVTDSNFTTALAEMIQPQLDSAINEIVDSLRKIDVLIQKRDYPQALQIVNYLKDKYKKAASVLFISGTVHYLVNDKATAISDLEKGLSIDSQNESAKRLLNKLKGGP